MQPWTFVHIADIQVGSPRSFRYAPAWNENWQTARRQILEINPDLLLIGGDLTRDGSIHRFELEGIKADLDSLPFPYYVIPGNMDTGNKHTRVQGARDDRDDITLNISSDQLKQFEDIFGKSSWSFVHKGVRFSGFCDMLVNSGLAEEDLLWAWLDKQKENPFEQNHVWLMHYALFIDSIDEGPFLITDPEEYLLWYFSIDEPGRSRLMDIFKATGTTNVISGHIHCRKVHKASDIRFDLAPATCVGQLESHWPDGDTTLGFLRYDVDDTEIKSEFVPLEKVSKEKGYGPTGHPTVEERDYSIAWEK